jgi:chemotaxis protein MotB
MSDVEKHQTIRIIKKKRRGHEAGHGGAWKVAYADFVTAMMALFIVLWIVAQNKPVKEAIAGYFRDPGAVHTTTKGSDGIMPGGKTTNVLPDLKPPGDPTEADVERLKSEGDKLAKIVASMPEFDRLKDKMQITLTKEGLRIELIESAEGLFFDLGSARLKPDAVKLLRVVGETVAGLPNKVVIEGHTDARPYAGTGYTNWELSADRANAARKILTDAGVRHTQITGVHGYADNRLKHAEKPLEFANRRVTILVEFAKGEQKAPAQPPGAAPGTPAVQGAPAVPAAAQPAVATPAATQEVPEAAARATPTKGGGNGRRGKKG